VWLHLILHHFGTLRFLVSYVAGYPNDGDSRAPGGKAGVVEDVTGRITGNRHLRQHDEVGPQTPRRGDGVQAALDVARQVGNGGGDLG
jgi:hypothetical protein